MGAIQFKRAEVGLQTTFGTPAACAIQFPGQIELADMAEFQSAPYDAGTWTETEIVSKVADYLQLTIRGTAFFESLPVLLNSGIEDVAPGAAPPLYTHTYTIAPAAVAVPKPLTWLLGEVGNNIGATGPAVKVQDSYLQRITLSGNMNTKAVSLEAVMFGLKYDDAASNVGYAWTNPAITLPANLDKVNTLLGAVNIQDADTTGGNFLTMTAFSGAFLDWQWVFDTGLRPKWSSDGNAITYGGIRYVPPSATFRPVIRTNSTNYPLIKAKQMAMTYQELQLVLSGAASRALTINMTGRWTACPTPFDANDNEVVMKPTWKAATPYTQTTTPHWMAVINVSKHNWT